LLGGKQGLGDWLGGGAVIGVALGKSRTPSQITKNMNMAFGMPAVRTPARFIVRLVIARQAETRCIPVKRKIKRIRIRFGTRCRAGTARAIRAKITPPAGTASRAGYRQTGRGIETGMLNKIHSLSVEAAAAVPVVSAGKQAVSAVIEQYGIAANRAASKNFGTRVVSSLSHYLFLIVKLA